MKTLANRREIAERETEDQNRNEVIALEKMDAGINEKHGGERQNVPKAFLRKNREQVRPEHAGENARGHGQYQTGAEGPRHGFRSGASTGGNIQQRRDRQDGKGVAERSFDQQRYFDFTPQIYLLQTGRRIELLMQPRTAPIKSALSQEKCSAKRQTSATAAMERTIAEERQEKTRSEMFEDFAKL